MTRFVPVCSVDAQMPGPVATAVSSAAERYWTNVAYSLPFCVTYAMPVAPATLNANVLLVPFTRVHVPPPLCVASQMGRWVGSQSAKLSAMVPEPPDAGVTTRLNVAVFGATPLPAPVTVIG